MREGTTLAKTIDTFRYGKEFVKQAEKKKAETRQSGSHVIVKTPMGMAVVPVHPHELGTGLRKSLVRTFIAIGLGVMVIAIFLVWLV